MNPYTLGALKRICAEQTFEPGATLFRAGAFHPVMYLVVEGSAGIEVASVDSPNSTFELDGMFCLGEIGYFTGKPANANVVVTKRTTALEIDQKSLDQLERSSPESAVDFSRYIASKIDERLVQNEQFFGGKSNHERQDFDIYRCIDAQMLGQAQRLRYSVYCVELGRKSRYGDDKRKTIADKLDENGVSFVVTHKGVPIGTARVNLARDGELGILETLYGMPSSKFHPNSSSIVTKFAILKKFRSGGAYAKLLGAVTSYLVNSGIKEVFIDGIPGIANFYRIMGFKQCAENFIHYENGLSMPMKLSIEDYLSEKSTRKRDRFLSLMNIDLDSEKIVEMSSSGE